MHPKLQLQKFTYERHLESVKQIDDKIANIIKSNFNEKKAIILQEQWPKYCQTG